MAAQQVIKVTLSTKKVVLLRPLKISDTEIAAQEVAPKAGDSNQVLQILMQKALVKNLLIQIDDKAVSAVAREDMDGLFSMGEYSQLLQVVGEMAGGKDQGKPVVEFVHKA